MADLKTFAAFDINTLYTDVADSEKGFHGAHATMVHNGYASPPLGAVNLDNPGGTTRSLTQWNGAAYAGFTLGLSAFQAPYFYTSLSACYFGIDAGGGNPGVSFDAGDYMDYNRTSNAWRVAIGSADVLSITAAQTNTLTTSTLHQSSATLFKYSINTSAPANQKTWAVLQSTGELVSFVQSDSATLSSIYDRITRSGTAITVRALNESSGRLLVGPAAPDDGVTALQTTSLKAQSLALTAQPFMKFNGSILIGTGFGFSPQFSSGITVNGPNSANLTVSKAGKYVINFEELTAFSTATSQAEFLFNLKKNGSFYSYLRCAFTGNSSFYRGTGLSVVLDLLAGDQLSVDRFDGLSQTGNLSGYLYQLS